MEELRRNASELRSSAKPPNSYFVTLMHFLRGNLGAGVLAMGYAFKNAGLITGTVLSIFMAVLCLYLDHLLVYASKNFKTMYKLSDLPSFSETVEMSFNLVPKFRNWKIAAGNTVRGFIMFTQLGFCACYILFTASTMRTLLLNNYKWDYPVQMYVWIIFIPIMVISLGSSLKILTTSSFIANILFFLSIFYVFYYVLQDIRPISDVRLASSITTVPLFLGTIIFANEGIGLVIPLANEMDKVTNFTSTFGILKVGGFMLISAYTLMGFFCYLRFGDEAQGSVTLNLPTDQWQPIAVQIMVALALLMSYPLQFYVAAEVAMLEFIARHPTISYPDAWEYGIKTSMILLTFVCASTIPNLGLLISLIGSVGCAMLALMSPAFCDYCRRKMSQDDKENKNSIYDKLYIIGDYIILIISPFFIVICAYVSIYEIVDVISKNGFSYG